MRRLQCALLTTVAAIGFASVAAAADWTGFYLGANLGYSWGPWNTSSSQIIFDTLSQTADPKVNGWLGGLQGGYNVQSGTWVYGLEGDIQITGEKASQTWSTPGAATPPPPVPSRPSDGFEKRNR